MASKLTEITTQYHTFTDDQVLTKDQLNGFISYFEDQDRMTRVFLTGVGIVCGFKLKNVSAKSITISQGVGVTTDGDLITLQQPVSSDSIKSFVADELVLKHYRKFDDKFAAYPFFQRINKIESKFAVKQMELLELLPEPADKSQPLEKLIDLKDKTVLLYLESYAKEGDLCTTIDCDNQGIEQFVRLRFLLVSQKDADYIAKSDSIFSKHNVAQDFIKLPEFAVRRVVFKKPGLIGYDELKAVYHTAVNSDNLINNLIEGVARLYEGFGKVLQLDDLKDKIDKFQSNLKNIFAYTSAKTPVDFQYRYDFIKDLADTWNEIRRLLLSLKEECFPDIKAFPKHLLLGNLIEINTEPKQYRHHFYKSPALSCGSDRIDKCRTLVARLLKMAEGYAFKTGETRITPSLTGTELGERAIPFYYNLDEGLLKSWNHSKTKMSDQMKNLGYHREKLSNLPQIQNPLAFNTDGFNFFRIEGHQGKHYKTALDEISDIKENYGLPFDVKVLSLNINTENLNIDDYECEFQDLNLLLRSWTAEQECVLAEVSKLFSGFSTAEPGISVSNIAGVYGKIDLTGARPVHQVKQEELQQLGTVYSPVAPQYEKLTLTTGSAAAYKQFTQKSNVVPDNLIIQQNTLGEQMKTVFDKTGGGSVNDIIAGAKVEINKSIDIAEWDKDPEMKKLILEDSVELMAYTHILSRKIPAVLAEVTAEVVNDYRISLKELCNRAAKLKQEFQNSKLTSEQKSIIAVLITELAGICCSDVKLNILLEEIENRKKKIISGLSFSEFIKNHPGLEHKAGVKPGGTFILVYINKIKNTGTIVGVAGSGLSIIAERPVTSGLIRESEKIEIAGKGVVQEGLTVPTFEKVSPKAEMQYIEVLENYKQSLQKATGLTAESKEIKELQGIIQDYRTGLLDRIQFVSDIPDNTVIADFSLPYMCCSGCTPVNFIVQKPPAWLRLEKNVLCLGKENEIQYDVYPKDGEILSDTEVKGMNISNQKIVFNPKEFPPELYGKPIHFTVNNQVTDAELTVFKQPEVDFDFRRSSDLQNLITFTPKGDIEGAGFLWDFGDGSPLSAEIRPAHQYKTPENDADIVLVKLIVTRKDSLCAGTAEKEIQLERKTEISVELDGRDFCENIREGIMFSVIPDDAKIVIEGKGVERDANAHYLFIPAKAGVGTHSFTVNGEDSGITVTVHPVPKALFEPKQDGNQLILTNNSTGADSYIWYINQDKFESPDNKPFIIELVPGSPTSWKLSLAANSKYCGSVQTRVIEFTTRPVENCIENTSSIIRKDLEILQNLYVERSNYVVPVWISTSQIYGGTDEYKSGVLDDTLNYLNGKNNNGLTKLFYEVFNDSSKMIIELSGTPDSKEYQALLKLFALQLQLFYNVLTCQDIEIINESEKNLTELFNHILNILKVFREREIKFSEIILQFINEWVLKIEDKEILKKHAETLIEYLT